MRQPRSFICAYLFFCLGVFVFAQNRDLCPVVYGIDADPCPIKSGVDSLASDPGERFSMVLTNPPFGKNAQI